MINWNLVPNFERYEFDDPDHPGSGELIDGVLLLKLGELREDTWPIITHWRVGGCVDVNGTHGHATNSYHRKEQGYKAVDFHFKCNEDSRLQYYFVAKHGFPGLGVYYDFRSCKVGFHVDLRPKVITQRWKRVNGIYTYFLE